VDQNHIFCSHAGGKTYLIPEFRVKNVSISGRPFVKTDRSTSNSLIQFNFLLVSKNFSRELPDQKCKNTDFRLFVIAIENALNFGRFIEPFEVFDSSELKPRFVIVLESQDGILPGQSQV